MALRPTSTVRPWPRPRSCSGKFLQSVRLRLRARSPTSYILTGMRRYR